MPIKLSLTVNGKPVTAEIEPRTLLVQFLREQLNLTGTHVGCDTSQCGACTVLIDGRSAKACTIFAVQAEGSEIVTIEGLANDGELHPLQNGFWEEHGLQCGYCTPGMIMAGVNLLNENPNPSEKEIREGLSGNFCRCTGYHNIVKAVLAGAEAMRSQPAQAAAECEGARDDRPDAARLGRRMGSAQDATLRGVRPAGLRHPGGPQRRLLRPVPGARG